MNKGKWVVLALVLRLVLVAAVPVASAAPKSDLPDDGTSTKDEPSERPHKRCPAQGYATVRLLR
jgi:hypothetical protein